jgi:hypothetical protein
MTSTSFSRFTLGCSLLITAALFTAGCDELDSAAGNGPPAKPGLSPVSQQFVPLDDAPQSKPAPATNPAPAASPTAAAAPAGPAAAPAAAAAAPATSQMEKAQAGQGVQGQGYGGGMYTEPAHQYFQQRDRITFDIQIPKQMQLWKAEHNNRNPRDKAEYIKEILQPCGVTLPDLPPGKQYYYDAKTGELLVGPEKK